MELDKCVENQLYSCRRDCVKPMSLVMDDHGSQPHPRSSALRVSTKSKAPSPPGLKKLDSPGFSQWYPGNPHLTMEQKENLIDKDLNLVVVLPGGVEKMTTVHGSKPLMDLLVTLCAKYHLNPSGHTLELVTSNKKNTKLKPNALIGTLDAEKILLKPKGEDKNKKTGPQVPEATVRMVINYKKTQKTILRVNPRVPLADHLPAICEKCEFDVESTVLMRDVQSLAPLDLSSSLNDYAIREVYARDTRVPPASPLFHTSPTHAGTVMPGKDKNQKEQENKGLFSKFKKSKKKSDQATAVSAPASPVLVSKPRPLSMALPSSNSTLLDSPSSPTDAPKKRRAPQPPIVVSQSCSSDLSTRRRLYSEPAQLDSDQLSGISRGSSAESSLKRTKRKAPPPPTALSVVPQETVPPDENLQVVVAANTLEEIMEQEETSVSALSPTASDTQGEDSSLNMSTEASLHSPSPDTERLSTMSTEGNGEDQSHDLSSDGNVLQSTVSSTATLSDVRTTDIGSPELANTSNGQGQVDGVSQQPVSEEPTPERVEGDYSTLPSSLPLPVMKDAQAQASVQANTETPREHPDRLESPVATSASRPTGEDAQVQTDFTPLHEPPQRHMDIAPSSANAPVLETAGKKETATSTDELDTPDLQHTLPPSAETSTCQDSTPSAPAAAKAPSTYATNSEPKPKPSNELTRNYIPKVGMTTYTIVPQKSLEKLRYFEVALTLESPTAAPEGGLNIDSLQLEDRGRTEAAKAKSELHSTVPREDLLTSTTTSTTTTTQDTVNGSLPESIHPSSPTRLPEADDMMSPLANMVSQGGSPTEVKQVKIPPATKPKPGSFRLPQHKKTPGYYVTSAAGKSPVTSPVTSPVSVQREAQETAVREDFPPPPPPVLYEEETAGASSVQLSPTRVNKPLERMTRQSSLPCREPKLALSLEKLRSFAAPRPYSPSTPSRFAQAVSSAVKRSNSLSYSMKSPRSPSLSPSLSPIPSPSPGTESKGLSKLMDGENGQAYSDKGTTLQGAVNEPSAFSETVQVEGESSP